MGVTLSLLWRHHFAVLLHQSRKLNQRCRCTVNIIYMDSITTKNISKRGVWLRSIPLVHFNLKKDRFTNEKENIFERKRLFRNFPLIPNERECVRRHTDVIREHRYQRQSVVLPHQIAAAKVHIKIEEFYDVTHQMMYLFRHDPAILKKSWWKRVKG